jgi:hypothetical protein
MGLVPDGDRIRVCKALIFTAVYSRHQFVWPCFRETTEEVIRGCEAAWGYFGGVFPVIIPDQMSAIIDDADNLAPKFNDTFLEYAQSRGLVIDPARIRHPTDKPRCERVVRYTRSNWFAGESFRDLADARAKAETWCTVVAGMRVHGTTCLRPIEVFRAEEQPLLLPLPAGPFDIPSWSDPTVHRDFHCQVERAIYSLPYRLRGQKLKARADSKTVKFFLRGELVKLHAKQPPGGRSTDRADLPPGTDVYALRDIEHLKAMAGSHGPSIGTYAEAILDTPLPWTRMRQVYALLGLVKKWGASRVEQACRRALDAEAVDVKLVGRMIERAKEAEEAGEVRTASKPTVVQGRFARAAEEYRVLPAKSPDPEAEEGGDRGAEATTGGASEGGVA